MELDSNSKYRSDMKRLKPLVDAEQEKTKEEMLCKHFKVLEFYIMDFGSSLSHNRIEAYARRKMTFQYAHVVENQPML